VNDRLDIPAHLVPAYRACARITRTRSSSYHLASRLLPARRRPFVHSLYAFARVADDLVDDHVDDPDHDSSAALADYRAAFGRAVGGDPVDEPSLTAIAHTIAVWDLPLDAFDRFFRSMEMDVTIAAYETWDDLLSYMDGSAAVIGELMLPILGSADPERALVPARDLGMAFQLTNFLRDVAEDLGRGRQYLPCADQRRFGVDLDEGRCTPGFVDLMRYEIERCRILYRSADTGIALLPTRSARCIRVASSLYEGILDRIEEHGHDVFTHHARLSGAEKARLATAAMLRH
jgi:phytoene synthase